MLQTRQRLITAWRKNWLSPGLDDLAKKRGLGIVKNATGATSIDDLLVAKVLKMLGQIINIGPGKQLADINGYPRADFNRWAVGLIADPGIFTTAQDSLASVDTAIIDIQQGVKMDLTERFEDALKVAFQYHRNQTRKGSDGVPYIGHLLGVAAIVIDGGGTEDEAIAARPTTLTNSWLG